MAYFNSYEDVIRQLGVEKNPVPARRLTFSVPDARGELEKAMKVVCDHMGERLQWLPEYDRVAEWLSGNKGKGLFLYGSCGRGKSLLVRYALPMIFRNHLSRIVTVVDCGKTMTDIDGVLARKVIALDDIGVEADQNQYGTLRNVVVETINRAQDCPDILLLASSNLDEGKLRERYRDRILDRIRYLFYRVPFNGPSLRK